MKNYNISDEEIFKLRQEKMSYRKIADKISETKGIKISYNLVRSRCKRIYKEKGLEEPEVERANNKTNKKSSYTRKKPKNIGTKITDSQLIALSQSGYSYENMVLYFKERNIDVTYVQIRNRCEKIFKNTDGKPKSITRNRLEITDEEIFTLGQTGMPCTKITKYFQSKGIKVCYETIRSRYNEIFESKRTSKPKVTKTSTGHRSRVSSISKEKVYKLRFAGMTFQNIAKYFKRIGQPVSSVTISTLCTEYCQENNLPIPPSSTSVRVSVDQKTLEELEEELQSLIEYKKKSTRLLNRANQVIKSEKNIEK